MLGYSVPMSSDIFINFNFIMSWLFEINKNLEKTGFSFLMTAMSNTAAAIQWLLDVERPPVHSAP